MMTQQLKVKETLKGIEEIKGYITFKHVDDDKFSVMVQKEGNTFEADMTTTYDGERMIRVLYIQNKKSGVTIGLWNGSDKVNVLVTN
jgi:hypothetical protein